MFACWSADSEGLWPRSQRHQLIDPEPPPTVGQPWSPCALEDGEARELDETLHDSTQQSPLSTESESWTQTCPPGNATQLLSWTMPKKLQFCEVATIKQQSLWLLSMQARASPPPCLSSQCKPEPPHTLALNASQPNPLPHLSSQCRPTPLLVPPLSLPATL